MTLGELVIKYRTTHNLSQRQFAAICGLSNGYISMLEKNKNPKTGQPLIPTLPVLKKIADGMGITVNELFNTSDDISIDLLMNRKGREPTSEIESGLSELDWEIIGYLSDLTPEQKRFLLAQLKTFHEQTQ